MSYISGFEARGAYVRVEPGVNKTGDSSLKVEKQVDGKASTVAQQTLSRKDIQVQERKRRIAQRNRNKEAATPLQGKKRSVKSESVTVKMQNDNAKKSTGTISKIATYVKALFSPAPIDDSTIILELLREIEWLHKEPPEAILKRLETKVGTDAYNKFIQETTEALKRLKNSGIDANGFITHQLADQILYLARDESVKFKDLTGIVKTTFNSVLYGPLISCGIRYLENNYPHMRRPDILCPLLGTQEEIFEWMVVMEIGASKKYLSLYYDKESQIRERKTLDKAKKLLGIESHLFKSIAKPPSSPYKLTSLYNKFVHLLFSKGSD